MKYILIILGIVVMVFMAGSGIIILAIAWTHYPQGIIRAWLEKRTKK